MPPYTTPTTEPGNRRQIILAAVFLVLAVAALVVPDQYQDMIASGLRASALSPFVRVQEEVAHTRQRAEDADLLRAQMDSLAAVLVTRATLEEENRRLRELLALSERAGPSFRPTTVLRPGTAGSGSTFLLDAGYQEGVRENAAVIVRSGLLGLVREVRPHSAQGIDWTHPDFRASAMTGDGRIFGIVEVRRGAFRESDRLVFNGAAFQSDLEDGTLVVTSGLGGVFPRGIPLGRVQGLAEAEAGWRKSYWLRAAVDPGEATHSLVAVGGEAEGIPGDLSSLWPPDSVRARFARRVEELQAPMAADSLLTPVEAVGDTFHTRGSLIAGLRVEGAGAPPGRAAPPPDREPRPSPGQTGGQDTQTRPRITPPVTQPIQPRPPPADTAGGGGEPADTPRRRFPAPRDTVRIPADTTPPPRVGATRAPGTAGTGGGVGAGGPIAPGSDGTAGAPEGSP